MHRRGDDVLARAERVPRFAIYASIGLGEVFLLFTISLAVERRIRNRDYAPEWRR